MVGLRKGLGHISMIDLGEDNFSCSKIYIMLAFRLQSITDSLAFAYLATLDRCVRSMAHVDSGVDWQQPMGVI